MPLARVEEERIAQEARKREAEKRMALLAAERERQHEEYLVRRQRHAAKRGAQAAAERARLVVPGFREREYWKRGTAAWDKEDGMVVGEGAVLERVAEEMGLHAEWVFKNET